mmetsp:Transcript_14317/g.46724  ORF Transcript_14317/g.46724 Transcript_14317/m.46724 type:complete len:338 (-) Transcript_14317:184-1197(-)
MDFQKDDDVDGLKYERSLAAAFNDAGFDCVGADMQSYGRSDGRTGHRAYFEDFDHIVDDSFAVASYAIEAYGSGVPVFFLGVSFGGLVAASVAAECGGGGAPQQQENDDDLPPRTETRDEQTPEERDLGRDGRRRDDAPHVQAQRRALVASRLSGLLLLAPALSLEKLKKKPTNSLLLPIVSVLATYAPTLALGEKPEGRYPQILAAMKQDSTLPFESPHRTGCYHGNFRVRVGKATLDATDRLRDCTLKKSNGSLLFLQSLPTLIVHSDHDTMTDPDGSLEFADSVNASFLKTQEIPGCDQMWHCLTQEPGCEALFDRLTQWILRQDVVATFDEQG